MPASTNLSKAAALLVFLLIPACSGKGKGEDGSQDPTVEDIPAEEARDLPDQETMPDSPDDEPDGTDSVEADDLPEDAVDSTGDETGETPEPVVSIVCVDSIEDVYVTPDDLPPHDPSLRGEILRCSRESALTADQVTARIASAGITGVAAATGIETVLIAYRTERMGDLGGVGTARVYIPFISRPGPAPMVVSNHGTVGLADSCAPSRNGTFSDDITLPFAGTGYVVVAPDYAGLGNEGIQGYFRNDDTAHSVLDAARAARNLLNPESMSDDIVIVGHSQGGGASLATQALAGSYGSGGTVRAVVACAPGWSYEELDPAAFQFPDIIPSTAIILMTLYADAANGIGLDHAADFFDPSKRGDIENAVSTMCLVELTLWTTLNAPTLGSLLDETFYRTAYDCMTGGACTEPGAGYVDRMRSNLQPLDPSGAPVLFVQGLLDEIRAPDSARCMVEAMTAQGVPPRLCVDDGANHMNIARRNMAFILQWTDAVLGGVEPPRCLNETLPACR
jgi:pimeloyl-ACP methyl ester carboxylesterase